MPYYGGTPMAADPKFLMDRLMRNGMSRMQAAAVVGNLQRESGLASNNMNKDEGAYGLMQWRGPRFEQLQNFAAKQGVPWTDPGAQADFIAHEMNTTERKNAGQFMAAKTVDEASAALKPVIRYGDKSGPERAMHARNFFGAADPVTPEAGAAPSPLASGQPPAAQPAVSPYFTGGSRPVTVNYANVPSVRERSGSVGQVLPTLSRGLYAPMAPNASAIGGGSAPGQLSQLRSGLPVAGQAEEAALPAVRGAGANASPGLQQAAGGPVAVSGASSYAAPQRSTGNVDYEDQSYRPPARGMRGGIQAIGEALGAYARNPQRAQANIAAFGNRLSGLTGLGGGAPVAQTPPGADPGRSALAARLAGGQGQGLPGAQSYTEPATGNRMVTGAPGRYSQGDVLNVGPAATDLTSHAPVSMAPPGAPEPPRFPGGIPQPRPRPLTGPSLPPDDRLLGAGPSVAELGMGSLVDPTRFDYG